MTSSYSRTAFERQKRGSFVLTLPTGKRLSFKDAAHRGQAWSALTTHRFPTMLDLVQYATSLPNGYSSFIDDRV